MPGPAAAPCTSAAEVVGNNAGPRLSGGSGQPTRQPTETVSTLEGPLPLPLTATQLAGFQHLRQDSRSREELIEQGVPSVQANAVLVRRHEEEVLVAHFRCWILLFSLVVCLATPAMIGLLIWLVVADLENRNVHCGVPLQTWVRVIFGIVFFQSTVNRPTPSGSCVQRVFCRWTRDPQNPQPMPVRVWLWNVVFILFTFAWNCVGLHWVTVDGKAGGDAVSCREAAPDLYNAVKVYAAFNLGVTLFMYINMFGFAQLLRVALHRGLLRTTNAAPSGSLEVNTEAATLTDPDVTEAQGCSICLEDFDAENPIVKTNHCHHVFHKQCLKGWLQVNRTCPLCRKDLGKAPLVGAAQAWE